MKKCMAVILVVMSVGPSFAQGRGPTRVGAPTNIGTAHNPTGNVGTNSGLEHSGKPSSTPPSDTGKEANAPDTGGFKNHGQYMAAQQISEHFGIPLDQLRTKMTGDQAESLGKAIQDLTDLSPTQANAEAKKAEAAAKKAEAAAKSKGKN